jgi:hypothetical protein
MMLMMAVLFTMLFQSVHVYRHWIADASSDTEKCHHESSLHHHNSDDDCGLCDFSFWYYVQTDVFNYSFYFPQAQIPYLLKEVAVVFSFSGSIFSLRAPPALV